MTLKPAAINIVPFSLILILLNCADYDLLNENDPDPVNLDITAVTDSTVSLKWTKSTAEDFKNYKVYYSRNDVVDNNDSLSDSLSFRIDTTKIVRKLAPGMRYYFRVIVNTESGNFSASNIVDTITLTDTASDSTGSLELYTPENVTDSSLTLRWSECKEAFDRYRIFADTVRLVNYTGYLAWTVSQDTVKTVTGLDSDKTYWFRVYAQKDTSFVAVSNSVEVQVEN